MPRRIRLATDHDVKVDKLFCNGRHIVLKAERILSQVVRRQDIVALSLLLSVQDDHVPGVFHIEINIDDPLHLLTVISSFQHVQLVMHILRCPVIISAKAFQDGCTRTVSIRRAARQGPAHPPACRILVLIAQLRFR
jgi:hypothetical protein